MPKLTKRFVEALRIKSKPYLVADGAIPDFYVRVLPSSKRSYYLQYRSKNGVKRRLLLGQHGVITAEQARDIAEAKRVEIKAGSDPQLEKTNKRREPLIRDTAERFMREYVTTHCKPRTQKGYRQYLDSYILPVLGDLQLSQITRADIASLHHSISVKRTQDIANRCIKVLSKMFNLAEIWGLRPEGTNPCRHIKKFPTKARERHLTHEEIKKLGDALNEIKSYPDENLAAAYCIALLLLTGCRLSEILMLKWTYIDYENKLLRLPDSKTGPKTVYAGAIVIDFLEHIKRNPNRPQDNLYVIWSQKKKGAHLINLHKPWRRVCKLAGLEDVRIHDLRHTFASVAVNKNTSLAMLAKLLGHTQVQTTARYAHLMKDPMIETAESITSGLGLLLKINTEHPDKQKETQPVDVPTVTGTNIEVPTYLTSDQAAEYLKVNQRLMDHWRWKKIGPPYIKVGHRIRYELKALKSWLLCSAIGQEGNQRTSTTGK